MKNCAWKIETLNHSLRDLLETLESFWAPAAPSNATLKHAYQHIHKADLLTLFKEVVGYCFSSWVALSKLQDLLVIREDLTKHFLVFCMVLFYRCCCIVLGTFECDLIPRSAISLGFEEIFVWYQYVLHLCNKSDDNQTHRRDSPRTFLVEFRSGSWAPRSLYLFHLCALTAYRYWATRSHDDRRHTHTTDRAKITLPIFACALEQCERSCFGSCHRERIVSLRRLT